MWIAAPQRRTIGPLDLSALADLDYCYLTTTGRKTGEPREIEIWFAVAPSVTGRLYLMAGGRERAHWVRNIVANPVVSVRIGDAVVSARGRVLVPDTEEDALARRLLFEKYEPRSGRLASWRDSSLPVALDIQQA